MNIRRGRKGGRSKTRNVGKQRSNVSLDDKTWEKKEPWKG